MSTDNKKTSFFEEEKVQLWEVYGIDDLEGEVFTQCSTIAKANTALHFLIHLGFDEASIKIRQSDLIIDHLEVDRSMIHLCSMNEIYEKLKSALWNNGTKAIDDFLGYDHDVNEDSDVTDSRMEEVICHMPSEYICSYYLKYCCDNDAVVEGIYPDKIDKETADILLNMFKARFLKEKGRPLTEKEAERCWWSISGVVTAAGYRAARNYVEKVKIL